MGARNTTHVSDEDKKEVVGEGTRSRLTSSNSVEDDDHNVLVPQPMQPISSSYTLSSPNLPQPKKDVSTSMLNT